MVVAAAFASGINYYNKNHKLSHTQDTQINSTQFSDDQQQQVIKIIRNAQNNTSAQFWVGLNGKIVQKLKDDDKGSRHQRFIISPSDGITVLVAHNIDLASRVPTDVGDIISLYGRYEWNNRGGVIHWTHHDPNAKRKGGWINVNGQIYR